MVEFSLKINKLQKVMYIPKQLVDLLGFEWTAIPNSASLVAFAADADLKVVKKSLEIIMLDLELRLSSKEAPAKTC